MEHLPYQLVQDFFHQPYVPNHLTHWRFWSQSYGSGDSNQGPGGLKTCLSGFDHGGHYSWDSFLVQGNQLGYLELQNTFFFKWMEMVISNHFLCRGPILRITLGCTCLFIFFKGLSLEHSCIVWVGVIE